MKTSIKVHINFQNKDTLTKVNNETMQIYIQQNGGDMERVRHSKNPIKSKQILQLLLPYATFTRLYRRNNECKTESARVNEKFFLGDKFLTRSWDINDYKYKEILHGSFYPVSISTHIYDKPYRLVFDEDKKYITMI